MWPEHIYGLEIYIKTIEHHTKFALLNYRFTWFYVKYFNKLLPVLNVKYTYVIILQKRKVMRAELDWLLSQREAVTMTLTQDKLKSTWNIMKILFLFSWLNKDFLIFLSQKRRPTPTSLTLSQKTLVTLTLTLKRTWWRDCATRCLFRGRMAWERLHWSTRWPISWAIR